MFYTSDITSNQSQIVKILLIGSFKYPIYANAFYYAWMELSHEVERIDYEDYHYKQVGVFAKLLNRIQDRYLVGFPMFIYNKQIIRKVEDFKPDLVFLYRCNNIFGSTIKKIKKKAVVFSYHNDDPFGGVPSNAFYRLYKNTTKFCHLNYVYRKKNVEDLRKIGVVNTKVLLPYYMKARNYPIDCKKDISVAFLGHYEPDGRDGIIKGLIDKGVAVKVFGSEWQHAPYYEHIKHVLAPATGEGYNDMINRSQILLVFFSKRNNDTYTRRSFEIPATRSFMLCEYTEDMDMMFPDGEAAVYFRNTDEAIDKCLYYLNNSELRKEIAENAYQKIMQMGGSEFDRAKEIISDYYEISGK